MYGLPEGFTLDQPAATPQPSAGPASLPAGFTMDAPPAGFTLDPPPAPAAVTPGAGPGAIKRGFVSGMIEQNPASLGEAFEGLSYLSPEQFSDTLRDAAADARGVAALRPEEYKRQSGSLWDVGSIGEALTWAGETLGQGLASTVPSAVTGGIGGVAGSRVSKTGATVGAVAGAAVPSAAFNYGELYKALKDAGVAPQQAAEWAVAGAVPMVALDAISLGPIVARLGGLDIAKREIARKIAQRIAGEAASGAKREGITEAAQEVVKEATVSLASDKPFWTVENLGQIAESGVAGVLTGSVTGGASGVKRDKTVTPPPGQQPPPTPPPPAGAAAPPDVPNVGSMPPTPAGPPAATPPAQSCSPARAR